MLVPFLRESALRGRVKMFSVLPPPPESCLRHPRNMDFSSSSLVNYTFASVYMCIYKEGEGEARYNLFLDVAKIFRILFFSFPRNFSHQQSFSKNRRFRIWVEEEGIIIIIIISSSFSMLSSRERIKK